MNRSAAEWTRDEIRTQMANASAKGKLKCDYFLLIPSEEVHEAGYRSFSLAFGVFWTSGRVQDSIIGVAHGKDNLDFRTEVCADVLPVSGLTRYWISGATMDVDAATSTVRVRAA